MKPFLFLLLSFFLLQSCSKDDSALSKDPLAIQPFDGDEELFGIKKMGKHIDGAFFMMKLGKEKYFYDSTTRMTVTFQQNEWEPFTLGYISTPIVDIITYDSLFIGVHDAFFYIGQDNHFFDGQLVVTVTYRNTEMVEGWFKGQANKMGYLSGLLDILPISGAFRLKILPPL